MDKFNLFSKMFCLLLAFGIVFTSCKKDDENIGDEFSISMQVNSVTSSSISCILSVVTNSNYKGGWFVGCMVGENDFPTIKENNGLLTVPIVNSGQYNIQFENLQPFTRYFLEGFVTNGTPYGKTIYYNSNVVPIMTSAE